MGSVSLANITLVSRWDVNYANDEQLRDVLACYFTWNHPYQRFFDETWFAHGLHENESGEMSKLLVHAVIAYGAVEMILPFFQQSSY